MIRGAHFKRFQVITYIALFWAAVITVRLFYFSIINRDKAFTQMEKESIEKRTVRALRGRILTADGKVLAQSRRISKLIMSHRVQSHQISAYLQILEKELKFNRRKMTIKIANTPNKIDIVLKDHLTLDEIKKVSKIFGLSRMIYIKMDFTREILVKNKKLKIGRVVQENGYLKGVSGFEKKYDERLRGQDMVYEAMVDKRGEIILETFNEIQKLVSGQDVFLTKEEWP